MLVDIYFDALNVAQNSLDSLTKLPKTGEQKAFARLVKLGMSPDRQVWFLSEPGLVKLAQFTPEVLDVRTLWESGEYWPGRPRAEFSPELNKASIAHRHFRLSLEAWKPGYDPGIAIEKLAEFLYIIRCNMAHGGKVLFPPYQEAGQRDFEVCSATLVVLDPLIQALFAFPDRRLAAYGTLRPGQVNHHLVATLGGQWTNGELLGVLETVEGLPAFQWNPDGAVVPVGLFESDELPNAWPKLDALEGSDYQRILVPVRRTDATLALANVYDRPG
jgi:gamma-glutamylcyclotransferase (GGCT)/AIG2-like uncharacterized protein YtfP